MKLRYLLPILAAFFVAGCTTPNTIPVIEKTEVSIFHPPQPPKVLMRDFEWQVLNTEEVEALLARSKNKNQEIVLFALTPKGYENLSLNIQELKRYILEQQEVIKYYRSLTTPQTTAKETK